MNEETKAWAEQQSRCYDALPPEWREFVRNHPLVLETVSLLRAYRQGVSLYEIKTFHSPMWLNQAQQEWNPPGTVMWGSDTVYRRGLKRY